MILFPENSRVCFVGDSITAAGGWLARAYQYYAKRFPESNVQFFNAATGCTTIPAAIRYFEVDLMQYRPTHVFLFYCGNDVGCEPIPPDASEEKKADRARRLVEYEKNLRTISKMITDRGIELIYELAPPAEAYVDPADETEGAKQANAIIRKVAPEFSSYPIIDFYTEMTRIKEILPGMYQEDHLHLAPLGESVMSRIFMQQCGWTDYTDEDLPNVIQLTEWNVAKMQIERIIRDIWVTEFNMLYRFWDSMTEEERLQRIRNRIPTKGEGQWSDYFLAVANMYGRQKPHLKKWMQALDLVSSCMYCEWEAGERK